MFFAMVLVRPCFRKSLGFFAMVLNWYLWIKFLLIKVVEVVNLLVVAGVGRVCLILVISRSSEILKKLKLKGGRTGFMEFLLKLV